MGTYVPARDDAEKAYPQYSLNFRAGGTFDALFRKVLMTTALKKKSPPPVLKVVPVKGAPAKAAPAVPAKAAIPAKPAMPAKPTAVKPTPLKPVAAKMPVPAKVPVVAVKAPVPAKGPVLAKAPVAVKAPAPARKHEFKAGDFVVYPTHGVGRIQKVDEQEIAGLKLELFVIAFEKDKMILRVPTTKAKAVGMRKLSTPDVVATALNTLKGRARIKRTMWSRRAQEYEAKINSGDLVSIAEVVRDLHRASGQPEQSYSERQLYEAALARMAREVAAIERIDEQAAVKRVESALVKKAA
jgi:CarD family transcriptional regulator